MSEKELGRHSLRRRRHWSTFLAVGLLVVIAVVTSGGLLVHARIRRAGDQQLAEVVARLDDLEPGWRWEDVLAQREVIPEGENSAPIILAAMKLLPNNWPQKPATPTRKSRAPLAGVEPLSSLQDRLDELEPFRALDTELAADLRAELQALAPALAEARKVIDRPKGRYTVAWTKDILSTGMDHIQQSRRCAQLLGLDAAARGSEKEYDGALASVRGVINAGRSIGDEPGTMSQMVRTACDTQAVRDLERVLAQGEASQSALASTTALLVDEAAQNLWLIAARGERGAALPILTSLYTGELNLQELTKGHYATSSGTDLLGWLFIRPIGHLGDAAALEYLSDLVRAAQNSPAERQEEVKTVEQRLREMKARKDLRMVSVVLLVPHVARFAEMNDCNQALLRSAQAGLALERYRLVHRRWPETLNELVPSFMSTIPDDPFNSDVLRYRRLEDGVVVYSVGPDREDNGGTLARRSPKMPKTDLGFQLWDPECRGRLASPKTQLGGSATSDQEATVGGNSK